jgi:hypothetical protein
MNDQTLAWLMMGIGTAQVVLLVLALVGTLNDRGLPKGPPGSPRSEGGFSASSHPLRKLGVTIMTVIDEALKRLDAFVKSVLESVKGVKDTNDTQTAKLAELQAALDAATSDDAADKAAIVSLQAEVDTLQASVADQINAVVDTLEKVTVTPPPVEAPVVEAPADQPTTDPVV